MRESKVQEIIGFCQDKNINLINLRNMRKQGKTRIVVTFKCNNCGKRYDMTWDNVKAQEFPGCCTSCAHKRSQDYRRLKAQDLINKFEQAGYKVVTPIDKIKPRGKDKNYNKTIVLIENKSGDQFKVCYNNFHNRLQYYIELNEQGIKPRTQDDIVLESKVKEYLDEIHIPYKREFTFGDLRGKNGGMLRFDFCLFYTDKDKLKLIEVDEFHHNIPSYRNKSHDKAKNFYCKNKNIPLLRISYKDFEEGKYKDLINQFIS